MGILSKIKGFIKLSEVAADSAQTLLDTSVNQDANTIITQTVNALEDALRKQSIVAISTGNITWSLNKITPDAGVDIVVKLLQNSSGQVINLNLSYANFVSGVSLPNDGDVFYIELDRSKITGTNVTIYNSGGNVGQRAVVGSGLPPLINNQSGGLQGTICIPIAVRQGTNIWWSQSNFYWSNGTTGNLGTPGSTLSSIIPTGAVMPFSGAAASVPTGYLLCDGTSISPALYPALATLYWNPATGFYLYGGGTGVPGPTPSGNFNLPNCQGIFIRGFGSQTIGLETYTSAATLGHTQNDATAVNSLSTGNNTHAHALKINSNSNPYDINADGVYGTSNGGFGVQTTNNNLTNQYTHNHSLSGDAETRPANIAMNYIVKA